VSAPRYILDTNIVIHIRQSRPPAVLRRFAALQPGEAALSVITYGELLYGLERVPQNAGARKVLTELTSLIPVLPLPEGAGEAYGRIRAALAAKGQIIGSNDLWIAAHAIAAGVTLVTNNVQEFRRVPGLRLENWAR
jgi:tRNA(fMet)-specific endonuclease VapC